MNITTLLIFFLTFKVNPVHLEIQSPLCCIHGKPRPEENYPNMSAKGAIPVTAEELAKQLLNLPKEQRKLPVKFLGWNTDQGDLYEVCHIKVWDNEEIQLMDD